MNNNNKLTRKIAFVAVLFAFVVIILGAYTRLTDAGLGCPDWPTCYNHLTVPEGAQAIKQAEASYPGFPVHIIKAWTEMIHRYAASILGLLILALGIIAVVNRKNTKALWVPFVLIALVIFQALLGKWTVTMRLLPLVVMGHLLGGFSIISLLWFYYLRSNEKRPVQSIMPRKLLSWSILGLIIVIMQIALGGWTSANYAALACPNFPFCVAHQFLPASNFKQAFNILNFSLSHLSHPALMTIQMMHRLGALITGVYIGLLSLCLIAIKNNPVIRKLGIALLIILAVQISLGIMNVVLLLPLSIALLHNAVAALLLLTVITVSYQLARTE